MTRGLMRTRDFGRDRGMKHPAFFGYGSLVNRATHDYAPATPARLAGWRRVWRHSTLRPVSFLSVERAEGVVIHGLVAAVPDDNWAALDARERAYDRAPLHPGAIAHEADWAHSVQVYELINDHQAPSQNAPLLLSYIDTVVQGFLREFGEAGVAEFFATTTGWDAPILNDRVSPRYARHQRLERSETALVDAHLSAVKPA